MARLHRRYRKGKKHKRSSDGGSPRHNPPLLADLAEFIGPGFAAFAATRFGTRIAATQIAKRKPTWGKHAGALASVGAFFAAWLLAHRIKWLAKYHTPIAVGAAIAAAQSLIQLYIPKLGWIVSDASPEIATTSQQQIATGSSQRQLPSDMQYVDDDPALYTYDDKYDSGRYTTEAQHTAQAKQHTPPGQPASAEEEMMDIDLEDGDAQTMGIFGGN